MPWARQIALSGPHCSSGVTPRYDYTILIRTPDGRCWDYGADGWGTTPPQRVSVHAPTNLEGWRIT